MQIHQLSVTYLPEQDRILVRINTREGEEMRLWLTRRLMVALWPMLTRMLTDHLVKLEGSGVAAADESLKKMVADFRKEEFLNSADFDTPYQEGSARLPLGEEPLLVTDVDATPVPGGPLRFTFNERLKGSESPRAFNLEMNPKLMQGVMHLLEQALVQSRWRDPFTGAPQEGPRPDAEAGDQRPRYLN